jgi:hypothetical protein
MSSNYRVHRAAPELMSMIFSLPIGHSTKFICGDLC